MPIEMGVTVHGRRAWFCLSWSCRFYDTVVEAWYKGSTDTELHFRREYDRRREIEGKGLWKTLPGKE
jgi:hypothetical protein